jgi:hypothetical protein
LPQLDAEGLAFLIEQARIHLYNMKVIELENAASQLAHSQRVSGKKQQGSKTTAAKPGSAGSDSSFRIEAAAGGSVYHVIYNNHWKMFSGDEMLAIVKICSQNDTVGLLAARLYRWLKAERSDFFGDIPVTGPSDSCLLDLVQVLRKTFTIKR